jgi:hypothetical protein
MFHNEHAQQLADAVSSFVSCAEAVPDNVFVQRFTEWAPRDVVAHLIGWNVYTLDGCCDIQQDNAPSYLSDEASDFEHVNAASVRRYTAEKKDELLGELRATAETLLTYLDSLDASEWENDFGVRGNSGKPALIGQQVDALTADYIGHAGEIQTWTHPAQG